MPPGRLYTAVPKWRYSVCMLSVRALRGRLFACSLIMTIVGCDPRIPRITSGEAPRAREVPSSEAVDPMALPDAPRRKIFSGWHLGRLVATLYVAEGSMAESSALTDPDKVTVRTSLQGITDTLEPFGPGRTTLPDLSDFRGPGNTSASDAADLSVHDAVDTLMGTDALNAYVLGRDLDELTALFDELKGASWKAKAMKRQVGEVNSILEDYKFSTRLPAADKLNADNLDAAVEDIYRDLDDLDQNSQ